MTRMARVKRTKDLPLACARVNAAWAVCVRENTTEAVRMRENMGCAHA